MKRSDIKILLKFANFWKATLLTNNQIKEWRFNSNLELLEFCCWALFLRKDFISKWIILKKAQPKCSNTCNNIEKYWLISKMNSRECSKVAKSREEYKCCKKKEIFNTTNFWQWFLWKNKNWHGMMWLTCSSQKYPKTTNNTTLYSI